MPISAEEFESWCFRNGGETFEEEDRSGILCWFPDANIPDRITYFPETGTYDVTTGGLFYTTRSMNQHSDSWIDDDDQLQIDTADARLTVDPR